MNQDDIDNGRLNVDIGVAPLKPAEYVNLRIGQWRTPLLALSVGIVLADSSVVTIALPKILARYHVELKTLAWVLTSFNLALALAALPAALLARRRPTLVYQVGIVLFAAASLMCGFASAFGVLIAGRTLQGIAGAGIVCAALALLRSTAGSEGAATRIWIVAGIAGAALGPAVGGVLTQLLGWESIFFVQAPAVLLGLLAVQGVHVATVVERIERPQIAANTALLLISGALVAALFLLVILLINGWRLAPLEAGLVVTIMPLAAITATRYGGVITPLWARAASGVVLIAGGLAALGWLPHAGWGWTVPPQLAIGVGLGFAVSSMSLQALAGRSPQLVHGGWTIAARHAGVVLGLVILTPLFNHDLHKSERHALAAGTAAVLDSSIPPLQKIGVARDILVAVDQAKAEARIPDIHKVVDHDSDSAYVDLASKLQDQLDRAVTNACSNAFLVAALIGLAALVPILLRRRELQD
jgi:MFS family permease